MITSTSSRVETARIADQLERAFRGGAWHGPALAQTLADVDAATASRRPSSGAHTIWEIALHAGAWIELADDRLEDPVAGSDPTMRGLLLGVLQHNVYHAGQIAILKKAGETSGEAE